MPEPRFDNLRAALGRDDEEDAAALKRVRKLFSRAPIGKPPSDKAILRALRGDQPASFEDTLLSAVNRNRTVIDGDDPGLGDALADTLRKKLGIPTQEGTDE